MNKITLILVLVFLSIQVTTAQKSADLNEDKTITNELSEAKKEIQNTINSMLTAQDVGEPDSFGKNVKFLGTATSGGVVVYNSCDPQILLNDLNITLGADDRCLSHTLGGPTSSATFNDIGRITIPGKSADNVIYFLVNNLVQYEFTNNFSNEFPGIVLYSPRLTIESTALNDPTAINPDTGLPLNGVLTVGISSSKFLNRSIAANGFESYFDNYSSAATRGFARSYFEDIGLPQSVIKELYKRPMTIKLNLRLVVRGVSYGYFRYTMRFMGN